MGNRMVARGMVVAACFLFLAASSSKALGPWQPPKPPKAAKLTFDGPAAVNMPIWAHVEFVDSERKAEWDVRYPFCPNPWDFGSYGFEVKQDDKTLPEIVLKRQVAAAMPPGIGSAAPQSSPKARLPLHLQCRIERPGTYQVRLRFLSYDRTGTKAWTPMSDWTPLEVKGTTAEERRAWLEKMKANRPEDKGLLVGDFLPNLLACPEEDVLPILRECAKSPDCFVQQFALNGLSYYSDDVIRRKLLQLLRSSGPTDLLGYVLSWQRDLLQPDAAQIVDVLTGYLKSDSAGQVGGALTGLHFVEADYSWKQQPDMPDRIEESVFENLPHIRGFRQREVLHPLCLFLGAAKGHGDRAREVLWDLARNPDPNVHEQALICIGWRKDPRDLTELGKELLKDDDGVRSIPYQMRNSYGKDATPFFLKALQEAPNDGVRYECAKELTLEGRAEGFAYLAKCVRAGGRYGQRAVQDVRDHFLSGKPGAQSTEEEILKFLDSKATSAEQQGAGKR